jgi:hypothetical protein
MQFHLYKGELMRARTILSLCCFLVLLLTGAALFAQPAPTAAAPSPALTSAAPFCAAPTTVPLDLAAESLGGNPTTQSACPAALSQQCVARWGQCALCYCIGSSCSCENRCF